MVKIEKESSNVVRITTTNMSILLPITNQTIMTKKTFNNIIEDIHKLNELDEDRLTRYFENIYAVLQNGEEPDILNDDANSLIDTIIDYRLSELIKTEDIWKKWVKPEKRTDNSVFFSKDEIMDILKVIELLKLVVFFAHSDYQVMIQRNLQTVSKIKYITLSKKLLSIVKARTFKWNAQDLQLVKSILTNDFLTLYNFDFIFSSVLASYNWTSNPIAFIAAVASENSNYLLLTYRSQQQTFSDVEVTTNLLDTLSYEIMLTTVENTIKKQYNIDSRLFTTPVTSLFAIPLFSLLSDVPVDYVLSKPTEKLLQYQLYLFLVALKSEELKKFLGISIKVLPIASLSPISIKKSPHPLVLETMKEDVSYYGLHTKDPINRIATQFASIIDAKDLVYIHNLNKINIQDLENSIKIAMRILSKVASDMAKEISEKFKPYFVNLLSDVSAKDISIHKL